MAEMNDYSGPLKPGVRFEDFSKQALIKLLYAYASAYGLAGNHYSDIITERYGEEEAWKCLVEYWMRLGPPVNQLICQAMNIEPKDVESWLKALQLDPGMPNNSSGILGPEYSDALRMEVKDKNHGTHTLKRCIALEGCEQVGDDRVIQICHGIEYPTFTNTARIAHNPKIMSKPLKLAPRKSKDEIACKWEYWIED